MVIELKEKKLFNPDGDDSLNKKSIINGNTTNLLNENEIKYGWANSLCERMMSNYWLPQRNALNQDKLDYETLDKNKQELFNSVLSFLTFLDSIQVNNIPKIADYITAPEIIACLTTQEFFELIHSKSYQYIINSLIPSYGRDNIFNKYRTNKVLFERNKYIATIYQDFWDNKTQENFAKVLIANYILESLYFYNGFIIFYNFAQQNILMGVADIIREIQKDEHFHIELFAEMINDIEKENPNFFNKQMIYEMFDFSVNQEINWCKHILKNNNIIGLNEITSEKYTKYLANKRLQLIGLEKLYPDFDENPYQFLEKFSDKDSSTLKSNFFESKSTNYSQYTILKDWDKI